MKKFLFSTLISFTLLSAQELSTSLYEHFPAFSKLVEADAVHLSSDKSYNIGILFNPEDSDSRENADNLAALLKSELEKLSKLVELDFNYHMIPYAGKGKLYLFCANNKIKTLYVAQYMEDEDISKIKSIANQVKMITFTGSQDQFEAGLAVTVERDDSDQIVLVINQELVKQERVNFDTEVFSTFAKLEK
jgi:hypothetical protein